MYNVQTVEEENGDEEEDEQAQRRAAKETTAHKLIHILLHTEDAFIVKQMHTSNRCYKLSLN